MKKKEEKPKPVKPTNCLWCLGWGEMYDSDIWGTCCNCNGTGKAQS
jgi:hypothetical protein